AEALYVTSPGARALNTLVADVLATVLADLPTDRRLRVLEVGAGTGATTTAVLNRLTPGRVDYVFSDVSAGFLAPARQKLAAYPGVVFQVLDIERDPQEQGLPAHGFDIILAANVLHATADLRETLGHLKRLLAPSGLLVLVEGTQRQHWADLTFGLLDG